jgi:hypothetical protein
MDLATVATTILAAATTIAAVGAAMTPAVKTIKDAVAPLLARRRLQVVVLGDGSFCAALKASGYKAARSTKAAAGTVGASVVVLWRPPADTAAALLAEVQAIGPDAYVLIYTTDRLSVPLGDRVLLSNSSIRLRGDLAQVVEELD